MPEPTQYPVMTVDAPDPRWKDLYRVGGIVSLMLVGLVIFAIIAFFIWPYAAGFTSTESILTTLHDDPVGGLFSLDLVMLVTAPFTLLPLLALYVALKEINPSYALIALVLGLMSVALLIPTKPLSELLMLSEHYATAAAEAARSHYLAAAEALLALSSGTAWMMYTILGAVSTLILSLLMVRSRPFGKATAYLGMGNAIAGASIFLPVIGIPLSLLSTLGGAIWYILVARTLLRLSKQAPLS
ncbi:MAG: DUF4386 family protein [Anaerolineae bacterium]|nr:DUF4386 family protein [Anaerolineae bacterium]